MPIQLAMKTLRNDSLRLMRAKRPGQCQETQQRIQEGQWCIGDPEDSQVMFHLDSDFGQTYRFANGLL